MSGQSGALGVPTFQQVIRSQHCVLFAAILCPIHTHKYTSVCTLHNNIYTLLTSKHRNVQHTTYNIKHTVLSIYAEKTSLPARERAKETGVDNEPHNDAFPF